MQFTLEMKLDWCSLVSSLMWEIEVNGNFTLKELKERHQWEMRKTRVNEVRDRRVKRKSESGYREIEKQMREKREIDEKREIESKQ